MSRGDGASVSEEGHALPAPLRVLSVQFFAESQSADGLHGLRRLLHDDRGTGK